ncbi:MAG TPA: hypothetical protein ENI12_02765 [Nitrospirae bacterium]|nr:hypothetical protein [Nitrospirota bacterium]
MPRFTRIVFFLLLSSITLASCGWRTTGLENGFSDEPSTSPPRFEFSPEIRVTITDSFSDVTGARVRTFIYQEYDNVPGTLPSARKGRRGRGPLFNAYLIRQMDETGAVTSSSLSIERWVTDGVKKKSFIWRFHDGDMDGILEKVISVVVTESRDNTLLEMGGRDSEEAGDGFQDYYRKMELKLRERGVMDPF